jgi:hypothetical protein
MNTLSHRLVLKLRNEIRKELIDGIIPLLESQINEIVEDIDLEPLVEECLNDMQVEAIAESCAAASVTPALKPWTFEPQEPETAIAAAPISISDLMREAIQKHKKGT